MITALNQLFDVVEAAGLTCPDFVEDSFAMLATAIAKLPPEERKRVLAEVEGGRLRDATKLFDGLPSPYPRTAGKGVGH
jgi:hypothetical protein